MLGARPAASRPEARTAWDYARRCADRYLARRLRDLDDQARADLDARQQAILDNAPTFDPGELERARQRLAATRAGHAGAGPVSPEQLLVQRLERAAATHRDWRRAAADAHALDAFDEALHAGQGEGVHHVALGPAPALHGR
jgi:hypothetical protein